jgi:hypothetical protein
VTINDTTGKSLDYWVSRAEMERSGACVDTEVVVKPYSTDPKLAQTIIDREHIQVSFTLDEDDIERSIAHVPPDGQICMADTDEEAAMMAYIHKVYGRQLLLSVLGK